MKIIRISIIFTNRLKYMPKVTKLLMKSTETHLSKHYQNSNLDQTVNPIYPPIKSLQKPPPKTNYCKEIRLMDLQETFLYKQLNPPTLNLDNKKFSQVAKVHIKFYEQTPLVSSVQIVNNMRPQAFLNKTV